MSDQGEKTCPLCAEEMDLTDQQLKPCKCGYEICVWCWHHIMDMAEKDETEGRCPACRNPYNKEKIVGTTAKCERLVSEMNVEKKLKSQKGKIKTSEGRKQLGSVRVIQRNLVYVVGLPLNFADEDLLHRREYFGQYGKVLKVSISRTATGAIQQFANSTCSVYITYSKEEEAVRCIRLVHGFILDGRPLRACFGTTKYCHAWLRNMPCSNPDCLYLHEIGSQEDSFTKDEIISAYTRSRVQEITGSSNSMQRRSGNVLPPPADDLCHSSSASPGKPIIKTATNTNNSAVSARISPPNSSSGRSAALPAGASWGTRASSNQPLSSNSCNGPLLSSKAVVSASHVSSWHCDTGKKKGPNEECTISQDKDKTETSEPVKMESKTDGRMAISDSSPESTHAATLALSRRPDNPATIKPPSSTSNVIDSSRTSNGPPSEKDSIDETDGNINNACSDISSLSIHENHHLQNGYIEPVREPMIYQMSEKAANTIGEVCIASEESKFREGKLAQETQVDLHEVEDDLLSFHNQRIKDPEIATNTIPNFANTFSSSKHSNILASKFNNADGYINLDKQDIDRNSNLMVSTASNAKGHPRCILSDHEDNEYSNSFSSKQRSSVLGGAVDMGESSIISNILAMDFDPWDESLTSPQNLAGLLGETDKHQGSFGVQAPRKIQNSNQSRFSFAREEERTSQVSNFGRSMNYHDQAFKQHSIGNDFSSSSSLLQEKFVSHNGLPAFSCTETDIFASGHSHLSYNRLPVSRSQISPPPGFSVPSRAPPPGFTSHERTEQLFESLSGNHMLDNSSLLRNQYQPPSSGHTLSNGDIDFFDPAILAVGKGTLPGGTNNPGLDMRSNISPQLGTYENARFQSFIQQSLPPNQHQRFTDQGDSYSILGDAYGISSRIMEQTVSNNLSSFSQYGFPRSRDGITSNGQWDGWNEAQSGNNLGMAELLRTERLGFNKMYGGYDDSKIRMPSSGNLYNGTYGI